MARHKMHPTVSTVCVVYQTVLLLAGVYIARADYQLELQLISYNNSMGRLDDGNCCELLLPGGMCTLMDTCDTSFMISLRDPNISPSSQFTMQDVVTGDYDNTDYIDFPKCGTIPSALTSDYSNPLTFTVSASDWNVGQILRFRILARESDPGQFFTSFDDIGSFVFDIVRPSAPNAAFATVERLGGSEAYIRFRYRVICTSGACGPDCTGITNCTPFPGACDSCIPNPCQNGGTCNVDDTSGYTCSCPMGYSGFNCQQQNPCDSDPCQNGGTCMVDVANGFTCMCALGYTASNCAVDLCTPNPCQNQGTCMPLIGDYSCECVMGYSGMDCATNIFCSSNPCQDRGECTVTVNGYMCTCRTGYTGDNCEISICQSTPCLNGGMCEESENDDRGYACVCPMDYTGNNCETPNPCFPNPCQNQGTCLNPAGSASCLCTLEWDGNDCSMRRNVLCDQNPCFNGATCMMIDASVMCICPASFTGINCGIDISQVTNCLELGLLECTAGGCVTVTQRCDGIQHCSDGSDEESCPIGTSTVELSTGGAVAISAVLCSVVFLLTGAVLGGLVVYCITAKRAQYSVSSSSSEPQSPAPVYEEVTATDTHPKAIELSENIAYGPAMP